MKIAICFSGAIRSFKTCYPSIYKALVQPLNADVFMYLFTYGDDINVHKNNKDYKTHMKLQNDECDLDYVLEKTKPLKYVCNNYNKEWEKLILNGINGYEIIKNMNQHDINYAISAMGMYFGIYKANELKTIYETENNFKYDVVIRARIDFFYYDIFNKNTFSNIKPNEIILIKDSYCTNAKWEGNDKFFVSTSETMNKICNLYNEIPYFFKNKICPIEGQNLHKQQIKKLKLNINYIGDANTYLKYVTRHRVKIRTKTYKVYDCDTFLGFNLCEYLMQKGFNIMGVPKENNNKLLNILNKYCNFFMKDNSNIDLSIHFRLETLNKTTKSIFITENYKEYNKCSNVKNKFLLYNAFGYGKDKIVYNQINNKKNLLHINDACKFILDIIYNKNATENYELYGNISSPYFVFTNENINLNNAKLIETNNSTKHITNVMIYHNI